MLISLTTRMITLRLARHEQICITWYNSMSLVFEDMEKCLQWDKLEHSVCSTGLAFWDGINALPLPLDLSVDTTNINVSCGLWIIHSLKKIEDTVFDIAYQINLCWVLEIMNIWTSVAFLKANQVQSSHGWFALCSHTHKHSYWPPLLNFCILPGFSQLLQTKAQGSLTVLSCVFSYFNFIWLCNLFLFSAFFSSQPFLYILTAV